MSLVMSRCVGRVRRGGPRDAGQLPAGRDFYAERPASRSRLGGGEASPARYEGRLLPLGLRLQLGELRLFEMHGD